MSKNDEGSSAAVSAAEAPAEAPSARAKALREEILGSALNLDEVAYVLGLDRTTVAKYLRENVIVGFQIGREWLVPEDELRAYVKRMIAQRRELPRGEEGIADVPVRSELRSLFGRMRRDLLVPRKQRSGGDRFDRFTQRARRVLVLAQEEAVRLSHDRIGTEHLLLGLIIEGEGVGARALANLGVDLDAARDAVEAVVGRGERPVAGEIPLTPRAKKVLELGVEEANRLRHDYIGTEHLLLGLVREGEGIGANVLINLGVSLDAARAEVKRVLTRATGHDEPGPS
jgi:excisionase family DNA binding protein